MSEPLETVTERITTFEDGPDTVNERLSTGGPGPEGQPDTVHERLNGQPEPDTNEQAERPAQSALKPAWVDWAVACGAERADAEAMTKQDLIDEYGQD